MILTTPRWVLTDIEGTTTSISFVKDVLFPYARANLEKFIAESEHDPKISELCQAVAREAGLAPADTAAIVATLQGWIDEDRKQPALKELQGLMWRHGYDQGAFCADVYPDVPESLLAWHERGIELAVYSSGSVAAQKLLFGHTDHGDLLPLFSRFFDTNVGQKRDSSSYEKIAAGLGVEPSAVVFLSDVVEELVAAREGGMQAIHVVRPGTDVADFRPMATSFADIQFI